ncbi:hypothetical protein A3H80_02985 [Candidatus Roizmanbacteria bacterium RIFCSPLOWO2_02_FULL_37_19]|uniref:DDH domain-containing protein n=1 Tax=Candidatus Roizmanbacteria bacterium RIFCSPHIGHO2_02_FULL_37_24 TaxID=1802037 RepID=A0A1F7GY64_9BACT|nr:MAG: hypothetical protein A2862_00190 [Candidatus Roizmanbacteria bacterium RIFCSPHIGHO2_01_FULL_38_41]OGK24010.1 MAG: hypothetical protein A3C24_02885 [Candidatus Roizmanbacteria bacterium RIFCSPHIGHO2_02_FULL_37_24]OGK32376.1 MAG: hypothetical protein A3E10_04305 [Candidatus Roizmanbacteria bacterium RIFCSPHIGHO2_12_FULL_37_23]OGK44264.1 MAG: hypothetical protein A2956_00250 [Candidatus Roizmanbacteria bacterium RIFCSPLOWO2_01_FULL_37_57]OGK53734.1 MAG: hypothetical protein A3H80_02985 [Ca
MKNDAEIARIVKILAERQSISICLPTNPTLDSIASGTALYLALLQMGKNASIACGGDGDIDRQSRIAGIDKIQTSLVSDGDNLVVSFPYTEGSVDKVTYNIEENAFNLIIQPREGSAKLDPKKVSFNYTGGRPDVIITIYTATLNSLGTLYTSNKDQFTGVEIINIDRHFTNANYGTVNYVDKKSASVSEMVLDIVKTLRINLDKNIATNLYAGIVSATNNFTAHSVSANTFEASAFLLNNGAVKSPIGISQSMQRGSQLPGNINVAQQSLQPQQYMQYPPQQPLQQRQPRMNQPFPQGSGQQPRPAQQQQVVQQPVMPQQQPEVEMVGDDYDEPVFDERGDVQQQPGTVEQKESKGEGQAPKEWLKPKIFKGTNLL